MKTTKVTTRKATKVAKNEVENTPIIKGGKKATKKVVAKVVKAKRVKRILSATEKAERKLLRLAYKMVNLTQPDVKVRTEMKRSLADGAEILFFIFNGAVAE